METDLFGKKLPRGKGYYLTLVQFYAGIVHHRKLISPSGRGYGDFIHVLVVFDKLF
jgi:hypothetical protein